MAGQSIIIYNENHISWYLLNQNTGLTCNKKCARTAPRDMGQNSPAVTQRSRRRMQ